MKTYYGELTLKKWIDLILIKNIVIPEFQRNYVWNKEKVKGLFESLKKDLYIPPVTIGRFVKFKESCKDDKEVFNYIIDGQQRLTSILLLYKEMFPSSTNKKIDKIKIQIYDDDKENGNEPDNEIVFKSLMDLVVANNDNNKRISISDESYSLNTDVATVSQSGEIYAKAIGNSKITATTEDGNFVATCDVNVVIKAASLSLNKSSLVMEVGDEETLIPNITPSDATNKSVTWQSSNPEIAAVDENGKVTGVSFGEADIICKTVQSDITAICNVKVEQTQVTGIKLNKNLIEMEVGDEETLTATITPSNSTNKSVIWVIDDENIATIDNTGKIVAKSLGETIVTATTKDGDFSAICHVKVVIKVKNISLNKNSLRLEVGETETLTVTLIPENATNTNIIWKSSDENIATVDDKGKVKAKSSGNVSITAKTEDGNLTAICELEVFEYPYIKFESNRYFEIGLEAIYGRPEIYTSSDPSRGWVKRDSDSSYYCLDSSRSNNGEYVLYIRCLNVVYPFKPTTQSLGGGGSRCRGHWVGGINSISFTSSEASSYGTISCTSDIRTLLNYKDVENVAIPEYFFSYFFYNWKCLTSAPALPATTLSDSCYESMFRGCTSLTSAPNLPAKTLKYKCYRDMFLGCTSLTTAPVLPVTTLIDNCYESMFSGCTSLTSVPALLAENIQLVCYSSMFSGCISLKFSLSKNESEGYVNEYKLGSSYDSSRNYMNNMFENTGGTFTGTPESGQTLWTCNEVVYP